jgi:hypothetical protein
MAMTTRLLCSSSLLALALGACSSPDSSGALSVTPSSADVLTCTTLSLSASDPGGTWSVVPAAAGTVDAAGLYAAPNAVPAPPEAEVQYSLGGEVASATLRLATAHVGHSTAITDDAFFSSVPFERALVARGDRVYAVYPGPAGSSDPYPQDIRLARSDDGGATFSALPPFPSGHLGCAAAAIDAVDPDVVYLVFLAGEATGARGWVHLAVSGDGGATFPDEYVIADTVLGDLGMICPDVTSPAGDVVLVTGERHTPDGASHWVGTFRDEQRGAGFGTGSGDDSSNYYVDADTNMAATFGCPIDSNGEQRSPRVFSHGDTVCIAFESNPGSTCADPTDEEYVQCSLDGGATWSAPERLGATTGKAWPTGAVADDGTVAIAWTEVRSDLDEIVYAVGDGAPFDAPRQYPLDRAALGDPFGVADPVVAWEGGVLWLSFTISPSDDPQVVVDKSCDGGVTWSGAVRASDPQRRGSALLVTSKGVAVAAFDRAGEAPAVLIPLTP